MPYVSAIDAELDGTYPNLCPTRPNAAALGSTADYHRTLLDQQQQDPASYRKHGLVDLQHDDDTLPKSRKTSKWDKNRHDLQTNGARFRHPGLTQQDLEEFESLPLAIRRKYFSTLERLRLAQTSVLNASSHRHTRSNNIGSDLNSYRGARFNQVVACRRTQRPRPTTSPTIQSHPLPADSLSWAKLPAKIREKHLTREEQLLLAKQLRESVILDAADEAIYRIGRRLTHQPFAPAPLSFQEPNVDASDMEKDLSSSQKQDDLYDCFRWLDEDEDLDLSLALDDNARVQSEEFSVPKKERRPSFRRHLSISKIPFGTRISSDSSRPVTKDAVSIPPSPALSNFNAFPLQARRRSRAFSLITPRHMAHDSVASIDPGAAHYQDPEARLKLRVYLSSPQKFDEAIEFGFPSHDAFPVDPDQEHQRSAPRGSFHSPSADSENLKTFLADDRSSIDSEDMSMPDPESPKTPITFDQPPLRSIPRSSREDSQTKVSEGYAQAPVASREMTLRMTLTRPDLRACEEQIYGWSRDAYQPSSRLPQSSPFRDDSPSAMYMKARPKDSMDRIFADIDQDLDSQSAHDSVVKRFWKRVKRG